MAFNLVPDPPHAPNATTNGFDPVAGSTLTLDSTGGIAYHWDWQRVLPIAMSLFLEHLWRFLRTALGILHRLWLEVTGAVFLGLAAFGGLSAVREWRAYRTGGALWEFMLALLFAIMMGGFGIYSFFRARRVR